VASGKELLTLKGHSGAVKAVAFSPDGQRIVTASEDGTAKVWQAATAEDVATWQREEQATAESLAARQRELAGAAERDRALRVHDVGAIKEWLVLLPIAFEGRDGGRALLGEQVAEESQLRPRAGDRIKTGTGDLVWRAVRLEDFQVDFHPLAGAKTDSAVAYAVSYLQSEAPQSGLLLKAGSDGQARIYLNGQEVCRRLSRGRVYTPDQDVAAGVELKAGVNVLVFKVANEAGPWRGSVRLTDAKGQPVKVLRVTLIPP
jgi:WD40 repeat protein